MRIVVTGGAGFIGANLCRRLAGDPRVTEVVAVDDLSTGLRSNLDGVDVQLVEASVLDEAAMRNVAQGAHSVVHLAARPSVARSVADPLATHHANATGTLAVLEAARAAGGVHVVVASSSSVYGSEPTLPKHEDLPTRPLSPYGASKLATEAYALAYGVSYGMRTLALRLFNVYGPLQPAGHAYAAALPTFLAAGLAGEPVTIHGDGTQSRDFTYVDSVTAVLADGAVRRVASDVPVNLAFGGRTSLLEVLAAIEDLLGHPIERRHLPARPGDVPHSQGRDDRLRLLFPDVEPVSLADGLAATLDWLRSS